MAAYFLDTSALVKRYATETGTAWVTGLIAPAAGNLILVARITGVETVAAIARKLKGKLLSHADAATALTTARQEFGGLFLVVEVTPALLTAASDLAEKHALRGYDAVQLSAALEAGTERRRLPTFMNRTNLARDIHELMQERFQSLCLPSTRTRGWPKPSPRARPYSNTTPPPATRWTT